MLICAKLGTWRSVSTSQFTKQTESVGTVEIDINGEVASVMNPCLLVYSNIVKEGKSRTMSQRQPENPSASDLVNELEY